MGARTEIRLGMLGCEGLPPWDTALGFGASKWDTIQPGWSHLWDRVPMTIFLSTSEMELSEMPCKDDPAVEQAEEPLSEEPRLQTHESSDDAIVQQAGALTTEEPQDGVEHPKQRCPRRCAFRHPGARFRRC